MRIFLNHTPPANPNLCSASNSILSSILNNNNYSCETIYWNVELLELTTNLFKETDDFSKLFPFYYVLAIMYGDKDVINILKVALISHNSSLRILSETIYEEELEKLRLELRNRIIERIRRLEVSKEEKVVFGFSFKLYQWIPSLVIIDIIKEIYPDSIILFGGIDNKELAVKLLKNFKQIDYTIFGEGELSILQFCDLIDYDKSLSSVNGLGFRSGKSIIVNNQINHSVYNQISYNHQETNDFIKAHENISNLFITLDTVRGCQWNKCRFCVLNKGYLYFERQVDDIIQEIENSIAKHNIKRFAFTDNDIAGKNDNRLDNLLDSLINLNKKYSNNIDLAAEIVHFNVTKMQIKKLAEAGFIDMQIGHESLSDNLLAKMNKKTRFSHNIFFIKHSLAKGISLGVNLIAGVPNEEREDLLETSRNMHFMRFFLNHKLLSQEIIPFYLSSQSMYWKSLSESERETYYFNDIYHFLPKGIINIRDRFSFFDFHKNAHKNIEWLNIEKIQDYYLSNEFTYSLERINSEKSCYSEFINGVLLYKLELGELYIRVLKILEEKVRSLKEMYFEIRRTYRNTNIDELMDVLNEMKESHLVYFSREYQFITSIISIDEKF